MKKELEVVAALIKKGGKVLLCQRKSDDHYADFWEFPGGVVESGEAYEEAIKREIAEELGLRIKARKLIATFMDEDHTLKIKVYLYGCVRVGGTIVAKDCQAFGFFSFKEMVGLALAPVDIQIAGYLERNRKNV